MLDHFDASLASQVSAAGARRDRVINGVVWLGNWLETMTGMATLTATLLARSAAATSRLWPRIGAGWCVCSSAIAEWGLALRRGFSLLCQRMEIGTLLVELPEKG
jgi:hypothetical protein